MKFRYDSLPCLRNFASTVICNTEITKKNYLQTRESVHKFYNRSYFKEDVKLLPGRDHSPFMKFTSKVNSKTWSDLVVSYRIRGLRSCENVDDK